MIPNQWYVVLETREVTTKPIGVTRMGEKLVFWRDRSGQVHCFRDRCVHRGVQLSKGAILDNDCLQCPFHGFEYDTAGRVSKIPANGTDSPVAERFRVHSYPTYEAHDFIWIWWGDSATQHLRSPRFFDDIDDQFSFSTAHDPWDAHYSRVIENQLDVVHLPFVHHNTIGRGGRTLVDGPGLEWVDDDMFWVYVYNRVDDGTPSLKPGEVPIPNPDTDFKLEFIFPNLWQNHIQSDLRVVGAFAPIDDEHTLLYLRFYQQFVTTPVLRSLITRLALPYNLYIAHQDRRVVVTQQPKASALDSGEKLIPGDRPIVAYRKRRHQLMVEAGQLSSPEE